MSDWFQWPDDMADRGVPDYPGAAHETKHHWLEVQPVQNPAMEASGWTWETYLIDGDLRPLLASGTTPERGDAIILAERACKLPATYTRYRLCMSTGAEIGTFGTYAYYLTMETVEGGAVVEGNGTVAIVSDEASSPEHLSLVAAQRAAEDHVGLPLTGTPWAFEEDEYGGYTVAVGVR